MVRVWRGVAEPSSFLVAVAESGESIAKSSGAAARPPRFPYHFTPKRAPPETGRSASAKRTILSAAGALEFAHEAGEGCDGGGLDSVIKRDAHAADGAVAGRADQAGRGGFIGKFLFNGFVTTGDAENDVHF